VSGVATASGQVAITGVGIVSPLGCGWEEFSENLRRGASGIGPVTTLDLSGAPVRVGAEVRDVRADERLGGKGLKYVMRGTRLLAVGVQAALADAGLDDVERTCAETGLVVGTAHGNFAQTTDYTQKILTRDPVDLLPMEGFDAALNSATNFAAVRFKLQACTRTVSSGFASSADALGTAAGLIRSGQATRVVAGGMEQLSLDAFLLAAEEGRLALGEGQGLSMPFDRRRRGFVLGEGCYLLVLEDRDVARARGARVRGTLAGYGSRFTGGGRGADTVGALMAMTLERAGVAPGSLDLVCASANSSPEGDRVEATAIRQVVGSDVPVTAVKSMLGECMGASGALQTAAALVALESGTIPPTINTTEPDPEIAGIALATRPVARPVRTVLVPALDLQAGSACLVVTAD
jgi:3-oxoacyl-[acyl-carrier-protein] synthase II